MADQYVKPGPYITALPPDQESGFQAWVKKSKVPFDPSSQSDYDMRGFFKDNILSGKGMTTQVNKNDGLPHFTDQYKTPFHQSFSNESQYATPDAPRWINDHQLAEKNGNIVFDEKKPEGQRLSDYSPIVTPEMRRLAAIGGPPPVLPVAPVMSGGIPQLPASLPPEAVLTPTARDLTRNAVGRDQQELTRLTTTGSGVDQILHPTDGHQIGGLRRLGGIAAKIGDTALSVLAPGIAAALPGTSLHHLQLERQTNARLGSDLGADQQQAVTELQNAQPALKQAALENQTLKVQNQQQHYDDSAALGREKAENLLRSQGYKHDPDGKIIPLGYEELAPQQQGVIDAKKAQAEYASARADYEKSKGDPNSFIGQQAIARMNHAKALEGIAYQKIGLQSQGLELRKMNTEANLFGTVNGQKVVGAPELAGDDGEMHTVGFKAANNAIKQNKAIGGFQDVYGALDTLSQSAKNLAAKNGGKLNTPGVIFALSEAQKHGGQVGDFLHDYLRGANARNLSPEERDYVANIASTHENIQFLRAGGTTDAQIGRLTNMVPGAATPDIDYFTRQERQIRATADRVGKGYTGVSGGLGIPGRKSEGKAADPLGIR